jgi:hypothetical protein
MIYKYLVNLFGANFFIPLIWTQVLNKTPGLPQTP